MASGTTPSPVPRRAQRPRNFCTSPYTRLGAISHQEMRARVLKAVIAAMTD
jgi:hypothetical protein